MKTNKDAADLERNESSPLLEVPILKPNVDVGENSLYAIIKSGWLCPGVPLYTPPMLVVACVIGTVFGLPLGAWFVGSNDWPMPNGTMTYYFAIYFVVDFGLRLLIGLGKWFIMRCLGFSDAEVDLLCGPVVDIPTNAFLEKGGVWLYRVDSFSRKLPHVLHWAGLAHFTAYATHDAWSSYQFSVMGPTMSAIAQICTMTTTNFFMYMWVWLAVVRTADGYARRMNNLYCTMCSIVGMGVVTPLCSALLNSYYGQDHSSAMAFLFIITYPTAFGDCLAEIVGINGVLRFNVYGIGEINNKSVEGMLAMFLGSVIPSLPYAWCVGGFEWLCFVGVLATIAETWSPRGFDNVFIPIMTTVGAFIACYHTYDGRAAPGYGP